MSNVRFVGSHSYDLSLQEALERRFVAQKGIHDKPCAEAEAGDEGIQLTFAHELGVGVAEAEKQLLVLAGELFRELFFQSVQRVGNLLDGAFQAIATCLRVDVAVVQFFNEVCHHFAPPLSFRSARH